MQLKTKHQPNIIACCHRYCYHYYDMNRKIHSLLDDMNILYHQNVKKATRLANLIIRYFMYLDEGSFLYLCKPIFRPHLEYAIRVWVPRLQKKNGQHRKCAEKSYQTGS